MLHNSLRILHKLSSHCTKNSACLLRASKYDEYFYECIRSFMISKTMKIHFLWIICIYYIFSNSFEIPNWLIGSMIWRHVESNIDESILSAFVVEVSLASCIDVCCDQ